MDYLLALLCALLILWVGIPLVGLQLSLVLATLAVVLVAAQHIRRF